MPNDSTLKNSYFIAWKKFAATRTGLQHKIWKQSEIEFQKQNDGYNCGVYVCYYFYLLIIGTERLLNDEIDINDFRNNIRNTVNDFVGRI